MTTVTTREIGAFFAALGKQMIIEDGICAGALLSERASRMAIALNMEDDGDVDPDVAQAICRAANTEGADQIASWIHAFGDIELPITEAD